MSNRVRLLMEDMSIRSNYEILDYGKNKDEIKEIAEKRNIKVPSKDLAFFKCKYAMVDKENLNGCILPRKEVEKALESLNSKAIDKDHLRKNTIGYWLDAKLVGSDIVAYGCFWKSNFPEDYEEIKKRMSEGKMKISFEAWGDRKFNPDKSYNLLNIEFAGGALLFDTDPAFPDAEVMEFSTNRVLEFAKILEDSKKKKTKCKSCENEFEWVKEDEEFSICPNCKKKINKDGECASIETVESKKLTQTDTKEIFITTEIFKDNGSEVSRKVFSQRTNFYSDGTSFTEEHEVDANDTYINARIEELAKLLSKKTDKTDKESDMTNLQKSGKEGGTTVVDEFLKKYSKASAEELVKFLEGEISTLQTTLASKETELSTLKTEKEALSKNVEESKLVVENSKLEIEKLKTEFSTIKAELDKKIADEKATIVKARREEVGDFGKNLTDEDIMNDLKFENAKLKKSLDEAQKKPSGAGMASGAVKPQNTDESYTRQSSIQEKAWKKTK